MIIYVIITYDTEAVRKDVAPNQAHHAQSRRDFRWQESESKQYLPCSCHTEVQPHNAFMQRSPDLQCGFSPIPRAQNSWVLQ
jgi:hypothetical protein